MEHDSAAAITGERGLLAAIEEDKLSRTPAAGGVPRKAIDFCLKQAGASDSDLNLVAVAARPRQAWLRTERFRLGALLTRRGGAYGRGTVGRLSRELNHVRILKKTFATHAPLVDFEHHLCHAASAFYPSPFNRALVLTLDESGDMWSGMVAAGEGETLRVLHSMAFPNSFGWMYTQVADLLGFRPRRDEHKVQWLGRDATASYLPAFRKLFTPNSQGLPHLNRRYFGRGVGARSAFSSDFYQELGLAGAKAPVDPAFRAAIARSAQEYLEEAVIALAERFRKATGAEYLCVSGGVFLNVLLARALETRTGFRKVFVQPVSGNAGTALGAAALGRLRVTGKVQREVLRHLYLGPEPEAGQIKAVLDNCKIIYRYLPNEEELLEEAARILREDKILAWYQGRVEFGLRALGNRTILASPFSTYVIDNLNQYIKHREDFHPFAISVQAERAAEWFTCSENCRFMASVGQLKDAPEALRQFAFRGDSVRVHTADRETNPRFWNLLRKFGQQMPAAVLVNTSFNLFGEPLVCDPREAVRSFYCSGIDAMVIGNFVLTK